MLAVLNWSFQRFSTLPKLPRLPNCSISQYSACLDINVTVCFVSSASEALWVVNAYPDMNDELAYKGLFFLEHNLLFCLKSELIQQPETLLQLQSHLQTRARHTQGADKWNRVKNLRARFTQRANIQKHSRLPLKPKPTHSIAIHHLSKS